MSVRTHELDSMFCKTETQNRDQQVIYNLLIPSNINGLHDSCSVIAVSEPSEFRITKLFQQVIDETYFTGIRVP